MPIVSKPASIEKNAVAVFTLDKTVLAAVASVVADSYFSDSTKWSEVLIYYKSSEGNQREILKFDATQASPTANFLVSDKARNEFQVQKIVIKDFDNDSFTVTRSELVVADFDVTLGFELENVVFVDPLGVDTYDIVGGNSITKASGPLDNPNAYHSSIISQQKFSGDGYVEWTNGMDNNNYYFAGLCKNPRGSLTSDFDYMINKLDNAYDIYVGSTYTGVRISGSNINDILKIEKIGSDIKFYKNGTLYHTINIGVDTSDYFLEASFYNVGSGIAEAKISGNLN